MDPQGGKGPEQQPLTHSLVVIQHFNFSMSGTYWLNVSFSRSPGQRRPCVF